MHVHLLLRTVSVPRLEIINFHSDISYHLEGIKLFFDLLCKHRCEAVASGNLTTSIVLSARPGVVERDARAKANIEL